MELVSQYVCVFLYFYFSGILRLLIPMDIEKNRISLLHKMNFISPYIELPKKLSVNENLSGTAGGIGNAIMIGTGAILASLTSYYLENQSSSSYLVFIMLLSGALSYTSLYIFVLRNRLSFLLSYLHPLWKELQKTLQMY